MGAAHVYKKLFVVACVLLLSACGGGGGGSSGGSGGGGSALDADLSATSVTFTATEFDSLSPPSQNVTATARGGTVYLKLTGYSGASLGCAGTTSTCTITITVESPAGHAPGTSSQSLGVQICSDMACTNVLRTRQITINYTISPGVTLTTNPASVDLTVDQGDPPPARTLALTFANGTPASWSATAAYPAGNGTGWLTLTPSGNSLTVAATTLAPETYHASITITYRGPTWSNTVTLPVSYAIQSEPSVEFVAPYVAYVNESRPVVIRGKGFDRMTHPLQFGGVDALSVVHVSDTELHATPPAFGTPGTYTASIANDRGVTVSAGKFIVLAPHNFPYAAVPMPPANGGLTDKQAIFDAERQAVYFTKDPFTLSRARFASGAWTLDTLVLPDPVNHFDLSPDGDRLYIANTAGSITEYDLNTQTVTHTYTFPNQVADVAILNSGKALTHPGTQAILYQFPLDRTTSLTNPGGSQQISFSSPDQSRILVMSDGTGASDWIFDSRQETFFPTPIPPQVVGVWQLAMDRSATRIVARNDVYDANPVRLGSLSGLDGYMGVAVSPDGTRAYVIYNHTSPDETTLQVFDISGTSGPFPQVGSTITLPDYLGSNTSPVRISLDGRNLFIIGDLNMIVMPTPP